MYKYIIDMEKPGRNVPLVPLQWICIYLGKYYNYYNYILQFY
jgi:hypothetical protein